MSNSQSKQIAQWFKSDNEYNSYDDFFTDDTLVLHFEELVYGTTESVMNCYVLYDHCDKEYFICGKKCPTYGEYISDTDCEPREYNDFKFFCKSAKDMMRMLKCIMNVFCNDVNMTIYNYKDIFIDDTGEELEYIDYHTLECNQTSQKEIIKYDNMKFNDGLVKTMLRVLKKVRY